MQLQLATENLTSSSVKSESTNAGTTIHSLPPEITCEVLKYLDWKGLLAAKLTCHSWNQIMYSRQFWYYRDTQISTDEIIREPLDSYTITELEFWVLRRLRAQAAWGTGGSQYQKRFQKLTLPSWTDITLLPGGRWLLVQSKGQILSYDLNSLKITKQVLIDPGIEVERFTSDRMDRHGLWFDPLSTKLSYRLVMWNGSRSMLRTEIDSTRIFLYGIDLVGHGKDAFLRPRRITMLRDHHPSRTTQMILNDGYLVEYWMGISACGFYLFHYSPIESSEYEWKRIRVEFSESILVTEMYITPEGQIIATCRNNIYIYSFQQIEAHDARLKISPLYSFPMKCHHIPLYRSSLFWFRNLAWVITGYEDKLRLYRISSSREEPVTSVDLAHHPTHTKLGVYPFIGCTTSVIYRENQSIDIVTYPWD